MEVISLDGSHTHGAELKKGTDWINCNCGSRVFTLAYAEYDDYSNGVIAQCQECEQLLEIYKE